MILSDRDIRARLAKGDLVVDPLDDIDLQVQPASFLAPSFFLSDLGGRTG